MKITVDINAQERKLLDEMAREANCTKMKLVEIAVYNLIALWMKERGKITPMDAADDAALVSPVPLS